MGSRNLTDTAISPQRGGSDSTVARTSQATGETLLAPGRNHRSRVDRITGSTGKSIDGERVADGSVWPYGEGEEEVIGQHGLGYRSHLITDRAHRARCSWRSRAPSGRRSR